MQRYSENSQVWTHSIEKSVCPNQLTSCGQQNAWPNRCFINSALLCAKCGQGRMPETAFSEAYWATRNSRLLMAVGLKTKEKESTQQNCKWIHRNCATEHVLFFITTALNYFEILLIGIVIEHKSGLSSLHFVRKISLAWKLVIYSLCQGIRRSQSIQSSEELRDLNVAVCKLLEESQSCPASTKVSSFPKEGSRSLYAEKHRLLRTRI